MTVKSYLSYVSDIDTFPYDSNHGYYTLIAHDGIQAISFLTPRIAQYLSENDAFRIDKSKMTITLDIKFDSLEKRNELFASIANKWRKYPEFDISLNKGWRNELYTVYNPSKTPYIQIERSFSVILGVITYGVHINGYIPPHKSSNGKLRLWIPRRSYSKQTYPGMLDNTVAGGIGYPYGIWETALKECFEEAGLPTDFVKLHTKSSGVVSYIYQPEGKKGNVQPEVEYIYDIEFDNESEVVPRPVDGEAQDFKLMDIDEILQRLEAGEFKPNCGLIIIDFLIRFGYITAECDPNYLEIVSRCHRRMPFPTI